VPEEPLPWLLGVARRTLANERRGGRRRSALIEALTKGSLKPGDSPTPAEEQLRAVTAAVDQLPERDRELLRLIAWDGLTTKEAATVLGISHSACRVRLHRARRRLAQQLMPDDPAAKSKTGVRVVRLDARKET
jgi:RNA polymerase sigma-70 factor (ECF subfamily)